MSKCKYCGKSAWLFRNKHKDCAILHDTNEAKIDKMIYGCFFSNEDMSKLKKDIISLAKKSYISPRELDTIYITNYNKVVKQFLYDGMVTNQEEIKLTQFKDVFGFEQNFLDQQGLFQKFIKAVVVRDIANWAMPNVEFDSGLNMPFKLNKWEKVIWLFDDVELYEKDKINSLAKNFWNRSDSDDELFFSSTFSNDSVKTKGMKFLNVGQFVITNQNTYFLFDDDKYIKINVKNFTNLIPYQDWVWFKSQNKINSFQVFKNLDWRFTYNVMFNLNR